MVSEINTRRGCNGHVFVNNGGDNLDKKKEQLLVDTIANQIIQASDTKVNKSAIDRTYEATIMKVLFDKNTIKTDDNYNKYRVRYGNSEQDIVIDDGNAHSVNEKVYITAPCNNLGKKIIDFNKNFYPYKLVYTDGTSTENLNINGEIKQVTIDTITESWNVVTEYKKDKATEKIELDNNGFPTIVSNFFYPVQYKFAVENKDSDDENVIAMIFPDGQLMEIENF